MILLSVTDIVNFLIKQGSIFYLRSVNVLLTEQIKYMTVNCNNVALRENLILKHIELYEVL